jgi:hypothetical protein
VELWQATHALDILDLPPESVREIPTALQDLQTCWETQSAERGPRLVGDAVGGAVEVVQELPQPLLVLRHELSDPFGEQIAEERLLRGIVVLRRRGLDHRHPRDRDE